MTEKRLTCWGPPPIKIPTRGVDKSSALGIPAAADSTLSTLNTSVAASAIEVSSGIEPEAK